MCSKILSNIKNSKLFYDGGRYHIETSPLIRSANQWTGFYMITASVMKELTAFSRQLLTQKALFQMFERVLNIPLIDIRTKRLFFDNATYILDFL